MAGSLLLLCFMSSTMAFSEDSSNIDNQTAIANITHMNASEDQTTVANITHMNASNHQTAVTNFTQMNSTDHKTTKSHKKDQNTKSNMKASTCPNSWSSLCPVLTNHQNQLTNHQNQINGLQVQVAHVLLLKQGPKGDKGATGAAGPKGDKGDKGEKGDPGIPGPTQTFGNLVLGLLPFLATSDGIMMIDNTLTQASASVTISGSGGVPEMGPFNVDFPIIYTFPLKSGNVVTSTVPMPVYWRPLVST